MRATAVVALVSLVPAQWLFGAPPPSELLSARSDQVTAGAEQFWDASSATDSLTIDGVFQSGWVYAGLPGFKLFGKNVFTALEADILHRTLYHGDELVTDRLMQRYGVFAGVTVFNNGRQRGSVLAGTGLASDFTRLTSHAWYAHLIYDHRFVMSDKFEWGLGILFSYNLGQWRLPFNLLPSLSWRIAPGTMLKVAWDNITFEQRLFARTSAFAEVRYDLSFFDLGGDTRYEVQSVAAAAGVNVRLAGPVYVRLRYKELLWRDELVDAPGSEPWQDAGGRGRSLGLVLVYAR